MLYTDEVGAAGSSLAAVAVDNRRELSPAVEGAAACFLRAEGEINFYCWQSRPGDICQIGVYFRLAGSGASSLLSKVFQGRCR